MSSAELRLATIAAASACVFAWAAPADAQLLDHKDLTASIAMTIAQTAIETCKANGYAVSATVVGRNGEIIVQVRGDNTPPHTMENARRKAYTARTMKMTSDEFAKLMAQSEVRKQQATLPGIIGIPGGVPIKAGDDVIGGVGLSGSPGVDEPCVRAGLDKVADQLK